ncbi:glycosyltransferase family 2 protein [Nocardioides sp. MAHUQ-72]|uniref:glycosyltransferase family 2 protein n=1 Tax=unclassified Nocardioides TaxID=2615069 RepID=UPI0036148AA4
MSRVGVVTLARGRHRHLEAQHVSLARQQRRPDDYVVVAMGDPTIEERTVAGLRRRVVRLPADPRALPLAAARNQGVASVLERGADVVLLLDVDCLAGEALTSSYAGAVAARPGTVWSGPVTYLAPTAGDTALDHLHELDDPHPARPAPVPGELVEGADPRLFWSLSFALSAEAWARSGGFCGLYTGYGGEDTDFAFQLAGRGLAMGWVGSARAYHQHHPVEDPPVRHLDDILRNGALFHARWGEWPMEGWLEAFERRGLVTRDGVGWRRVDAAPAVGRQGRPEVLRSSGRTSRP